MKKFNFNVSSFIYSFLVYCFYLVGIVFLKRSNYESGIYYFTPAFLFVFFKLITIGPAKVPILTLYSLLPFLVSAYLSLKGGPAGWEVTGTIPVLILSTFLFKSGKRPVTPLKNIYMTRICSATLLFVVFFSTVHFLRTGNIDSSLYLAVSIYSPAPFLITLALFVNFIISTAAVSIILNNFELFNRGGKISRIIFDGDGFLSFPHFNLSGIETSPGVSNADFLNKVEKLNEIAGKTKEYAEQVKKNKLFSRKFKEGYTLAMAPLEVMIGSGTYKTTDIALPDENDDRSFVALAQDDRIIGYYAIDKITPSTNATMLDVIDKNYGVPSFIVDAQGEDVWQGCCSHIEKINDIDIAPTDLLITDKEQDVSCLTAYWGAKDTGRGDVFIVKPFLTTLLNLVIVTANIPDKFYKGTVLASLPFAFALFSVSMGLKIPQVSAASTMFSLVFTIMYVFYSKKRKKSK